MKIVPCKEHGLESLIAQSAHGYVRTPGLHMSDIYGGLYKELEPKRYDSGTPMDLLRLEAGMAFEEILERALKDRLLAVRPGEFTCDEGVIYSPDLLLYNHVVRMGEIKLTWLSSKEVPREPANGFPPKFDKYFTQMMSYCHCLETPYARLIAFFVNGAYDWKKGLAPELLAWDIEFSPRELRENWQMMMNFAKQRRML